MKFLVLALCICAASAASVGYKPWQPVQQVAKAFASAVVTAPRVVAKDAVVEPFKAVVVEPVKSVYEPAVKSAVYVDKDANADILRSETDVATDGFNYIYETSNGISAQSTGALKKVGNTEFLATQGGYRYVSPDGTPVEVTYVADENGFQVQSNALPVGPAIPEAILRSLEYNRAHPSKEVEKY